MPGRALFLLRDVNLPTFLNLLRSERAEGCLGLCCLSVCPSAAPARPRSCGNGGGEHTAVPILQISYEAQKLGELWEPWQGRGSEAVGCGRSAGKIPSDFRGTGSDLGNEKYR